MYSGSADVVDRLELDPCAEYRNAIAKMETQTTDKEETVISLEK